MNGILPELQARVRELENQNERLLARLSGFENNLEELRGQLGLDRLPQVDEATNSVDRAERLIGRPAR